MARGAAKSAELTRVVGKSRKVAKSTRIGLDRNRDIAAILREVRAIRAIVDPTIVCTIEPGADIESMHKQWERTLDPSTAGLWLPHTDSTPGERPVRHSGTALARARRFFLRMIGR